MAALVEPLVYLCLAVIFASLLMMVVFGLKNASSTLSGSKLGLAAFALPALIFVIVFALSQDAAYGPWKTAGVVTALVMTLSGFLALVIAGSRSLFS